MYTSGINWVDALIVIFIGLLIWRGIVYGFITQLFVIIGFFGGLILSGFIFPHIIPVKDHTTLAIVNGNLVLIVALFFSFTGYQLGGKIHYAFGKSWSHTTEKCFSVIFSVIFGLLAVWLIASMIGRLPFEGLSNSANDSVIVQQLDQRLFPIPAVFEEFGKQFNPNIQPKIFVKSQYQVQQNIPLSSSLLQLAAQQANKSVVRITSFGCGGLVSGSGFVVGKDLILTNAHVIAGVKRPIVKFGTQSYAAVPVLFNSSEDIALLRIHHLNEPQLQLLKDQVKNNTSVIIAGYPGGNFSAIPGLVLETVQLVVPNLNGYGSTTRQSYEVQANTSEGVSGGPMILEEGKVGGIIFARSQSINNHAFVITSQSIYKEVNRAQNEKIRVNTGVCLEV